MCDRDAMPGPDILCGATKVPVDRVIERIIEREVSSAIMIGLRTCHAKSASDIACDSRYRPGRRSPPVLLPPRSASIIPKSGAICQSVLPCMKTLNGAAYGGDADM